MCTDETKKLWKVIVTIASSDFVEKCELRRWTEDKLFDNFDNAKCFAADGDIDPLNRCWSRVVNAEIYEYEIASVKQLKQTKKETVRETVETKWVWECGRAESDRL